MQTIKNPVNLIILFGLKVINKLLSLFKSKIDQDILTNEIKDNILYLKISDIQQKLLQCDKTFLVGMILSMRLKDEQDVNECYNKLILHEAQN